MKSILLLAASLAFAPFTLAFANDTGQVDLDLPVIDTPFNFTGRGYTFPSMQQSLALSTDFYEGVHRAIQGGPESSRWRRWIILAPDLISQWTPLGSGWMHEEWHRAVMSRRRIASYDEINDFPIGRSMISVSHETDEDLARLKGDYPHEQVRLAEAGMEAQTTQNLLFAKHHFYDDSQTFDQAAMLLNTIGVSEYLATCASSQADSATDTQNREDGSSIAKRDFTGLDCTGWVRDLFRPDEPYSARGTHSSGVGINRYTRYSDLRDEERTFLRKNMLLSLVNFADPFLIGVDSFSYPFLGQEARWNARLSHYLTSFGYTVDLNVFLRYGPEDKKFFLQLHGGMNDAMLFPGLTFDRLDQKLPWDLYLDRGFTIWTQPRGQDVRTKAGDTMFAGHLRVTRKMGRLKPYVQVDAKTPGWLAGQVYLDRNVSVMTGLLVTAF